MIVHFLLYIVCVRIMNTITTIICIVMIIKITKFALKVVMSISSHILTMKHSICIVQTYAGYLKTLLITLSGIYLMASACRGIT